MDIDLIKKEAFDYLESTKSHLRIAGVNVEKREIELASQDNDFTCFISCPRSNQESWGIWSDKESCTSLVYHVWEICNLDSLSSITTLLQAVLRALSKSQNDDSKDISDEEDASDDEEDDFYGQGELDSVDEESRQYKEQEEEDTLAASFHNSQSSEIAVRRLVKDLRTLNGSKTKSGIDASPFKNDLFIWRVKLIDIPLETQLGKDLQLYSQTCSEEPVIHLEMQFPGEYPFCPPFIRVLKPRFKFLTGHVTIGGSICMQMLTKSGWQPTNDIESILIQVRAEILSDPNASLATDKTNTPYSLDEARIAFKRMTQKYGW